METTFTLQQRKILQEALDFDITRYLMVNSINNIDGSERSDRHMNMSKTICKFIFNIDLKNSSHYLVTGSWLAVHDYLADVLTDRMDEIIGFPIYEPLYNVDIYKKKFFNVIVENIKEIENVAKESLMN